LEEISLSGNKSRCDISEVESDIDPVKFYYEYYIHGKPVMIRGGASDWKFRKAWRRKEILRKVGRLKVRVGRIPYAGPFVTLTLTLTLTQALSPEP